MSPTFAQRWESAVQGTYGTPQTMLVRGLGASVWDADGRELTDMLAGIAVSSLGHAHPAVVAAVTHQISQLAHTSNLYANGPALALAERLVKLSGRPDGRVFLCNSGTEAVEAALKLARKLSAGRGVEQPRFVAAEGSFHGRTLGLAVTGQPAKRAPFGPMPGPVHFVPYGDLDALGEATAVAPTAAVVLEPILGEAGVVLPPVGYLSGAEDRAHAAGAVLILDEVQGGIGRAGRWFAHHRADLGGGVQPDVVTLAKGLAGGLPVGAMIAFGSAASALVAGDHGSTFGGNPVSAAAALAVLETIEVEGLLERSEELGELLREGLIALGHPLIKKVRGRGLWVGLVLHRPAAKAAERAWLQEGFLVNAAAPDVVRLTPPLVIRREQLERFIASVPGVLGAAEAAAQVARVKA